MINNEKSYITLRDAWDILISNIWLFVVSVVVCLGLAFGYIVTTPPVYKSTASIMIKSDKSGKSSVGGYSAFEDMSFIQTNTDINNEIYVLSNSTLMEEVVARLSLNYSYALKYKDIRWVDMYNDAPFVVRVDSLLDSAPFSFYMKIESVSDFTISNLVVAGRESASDIKGSFGVPIKCGNGSFTVESKSYLQEAGIGNLYSFLKVNIQSAANRYASNLVVALRSSEASIIDMSMTLGSKQKASDILNTLIAVYSENWVKDKNRITLSTTNFINDRLVIIGRELGSVDQDISSYKSTHLLPDVGAVTGMNLQSSNENLKKQIALNNQLSMANYILDYINDDAYGEQLLPVNSGIESQTINDQTKAYNELLLNKNAYLANSSVNNPVVADMISDLSAIKSGLVLSLNGLIETINIQIVNNQNDERVTRQKLSSNPTQELYLLSTGREQKIKEELYLFLLQKREENELSQAFTAYNTTVLNQARGSDVPVAPRRNVIILFGLVAGLVLPIIFLILKAGLNVTIERKSDLSSLSIPFLGMIPQLKSKRHFWQRSKKEERPVITSSGRDVLNESVRMVRTNLDFIIPRGGGCKVLNITSFHPKSGKSFISLNLALSLAFKNSKTLVVDGDYRRGTLSEAVDSPKKGSVNYINGRIDTIDEVIVKSKMHPLLDILPMGSMPPNPTELFLTERFALLVAELRDRYDYIIFDCPPIEIVPDATEVEKYCDTTLFIIRAGLMDKRELPDLQQLYESKRIKSMSLILNGVDYNMSRRYGYGKYGYGKYGYGSNKQ